MRKKLQELVTEMAKAEIPLDLAKREFEIAYLDQVLSRNGGNFTATAKQLGIHRNTLSRKVEQYYDSMSYHDVSCPEA